MSHPYSYTKDDGAYIFITDHDFTYNVIFYDLTFLYSEVLSNHVEVFSFTFDNNNTGKKKNDKRVSLTISKILFEFLREFPDVAVVYTCDNTDKKEKGRNKLFGEWFNSSENSGLIKYEYPVLSNIFHTLIVNKNHIFLGDIINGFNEICKMLNTE